MSPLKAVIYAMLLFSCIHLLTCGGEHVHNAPPLLSAVIYEHDTETPAVGAVIKVFDASVDEAEPVAVLVTAEDGSFSIDELPDGFYRFWGEKDSFVLFQDSVLITVDQTTLRDDTLECPSTVSGVVRLQEYHDLRTVSIGINGIDHPAIFAGNDGRFTLQGLAGGTWPLLLRSSIPEYLPTVRSVTIDPCSDDTIDDTLRLDHTGIPVVKGISLSQDTLTGRITLTWEKPEYKMLRDYLIYVDSCTSNKFLKQPIYITEDTVCIDTLNALDPDDPLDTVPRCLNYRIAVRNTLQQIGATCPEVRFPVVPKTYVTTFITHTVIYEQDSCDSASINDTVRVVLTASNLTRPLRTLYWCNPVDSDTIAEITVEDTTATELTDTLAYAFDTAGTHRLVAVVTDNAGIVAYDTIPIKIVRDTLRAYIDAGDNRVVISSDTIRLHGSAAQQFGEIVKWEWQIGSSNDWITTSEPDTSFAASLFDWMLECRLAVTDDDGNRAEDMVTIYINEVPEIHPVGITAGAFHDLLLDKDGSLFGRGMNSGGQLGSVSTRDWVSWTTVAEDVRETDAGNCHTLILKADGSLYTCGCNTGGQLGNGTVEDHFEPVKTMNDVRHVAAGADYSLTVKTDNSVWAWGNNSDGQLGDSSTTDHTTPVSVMADILAVSAGGAHSLFIKTDSSLWACGLNDHGQLGDGTTETHPYPVKVMNDVRKAVGGLAHTLILKNDGTLWACGWNYAGQLGDGTMEDRVTPVHISDDVADIAAGDYHSLLLKTDGSLLTFGENGIGQLGDSTTVDRYVPVKIMDDACDIEAGSWHSIMQKNDGTLWICGWICFDADSYGTTAVRPFPVRLLP